MTFGFVPSLCYDRSPRRSLPLQSLSEVLLRFVSINFRSMATHFNHQKSVCKVGHCLLVVRALGDVKSIMYTMCLKQLSCRIDTDTGSFSSLTTVVFSIPPMFAYLTNLRLSAGWRIGDLGSGWRT